MSQPEIRHATVDEILPLRSEVLRGGGPLERALLPGDREGLGVHWGAWVDGRLAACGSLYEVTDEEGHRSTQLRGMATAPDLRNGWHWWGAPRGGDRRVGGDSEPSGAALVQRTDSRRPLLYASPLQ